MRLSQPVAVEYCIYECNTSYVTQMGQNKERCHAAYTTAVAIQKVDTTFGKNNCLPDSRKSVHTHNTDNSQINSSSQNRLLYCLISRTLCLGSSKKKSRVFKRQLNLTYLLKYNEEPVIRPSPS